MRLTGPRTTILCLAVAGFTAAFSSPATAADEFNRAYQKEFAFLEAEKKELTARLKAMEEEEKQKENSAQGELLALQTQLLALQNEADSMEMDLQSAEKNNSELDENKDMIMETMDRANETLQRYGFDLSAPSDNPEVQATQIQSMMVAVETALDSGSEITREKGPFFLMNGQKVTGEILRIGHVAAYGISPQGSGALAPAGGAKLKVWDKSTAGTAEALLAGQNLSEFPIFIYESLEKSIDPKEQLGFVAYTTSGGIIAWIIFYLGVLGILLIIIRAIILARAGRRTDRLIHDVSELVDKGHFDKALDLCRKTRGAAGNVLMATIANLHKEREKLDDIISEAILHQMPSLERFGSSILVIASVGPLLGLLGTVTGMIATFDVITEYGTGDPKMLSGGISEALITTEYGLIVAIPCLLVGTLLSGRAAAITEAMERAALQIINKADLREGRLAAQNEQSAQPAGQGA